MRQRKRKNAQQRKFLRLRAGPHAAIKLALQQATQAERVEKMSELRNDVREQIAEIYNDALRKGEVAHDDICDELGDYWDDVEDCDDATLKAAYATARDAHEEDYDVAVALLKQALDMLEA
jgi:hypothetical protein